MNHTMRFNKDDVLFLTGQEPQDEIRIKMLPFKETNPLGAALISEQEDLTTRKRLIFLLTPISPESSDKVFLTLSKTRWN